MNGFDASHQMDGFDASHQMGGLQRLLCWEYTIKHALNVHLNLGTCTSVGAAAFSGKLDLQNPMQRIEKYVKHL